MELSFPKLNYPTTRTLIRSMSVYFSIGSAHLLLFIGVFALLQNQEVYTSTLGRISTNYERIGGWSDFEIKSSTAPFIELKEENFRNWDADIYGCISLHMYDPIPSCYGNVRGAFFPLFPAMWRISGGSALQVSLLNQLIFILSLSLLCAFLFKELNFESVLLFISLLALPSIVVYFIPYSESLFLFTMTLAVVGRIMNRYPIYFVGVFLMALVRPATVFALIAMMAVEFLIWRQNRDHKSAIRSLLEHLIPYTLGIGLVVLIQYFYTGSWTVYYEAQKAWEGGVRVFNGISDWSQEGFGLSVFALFFIGLPSILFCSYLFVRPNSRIGRKWICSLMKNGPAFLLTISLLYLSGILAFTVLTSGGNLHSFFRFML